MKKLTKQLFSLLIVASMLLSMITVAVAAVTTPTVTIKEVTVEDNIKKLVFTITTPVGSPKITSTGLIFSYDATKIMPVRNDEETKPLTDNELTASSSSTALKRPFKAFFYYDEEEDVEYSYNINKPQIMKIDNRIAVKIDTVTSDGDVIFDAKDGMAFVEFYFRAIDGAQLDKETFQLETEYTDGSPLKTWYKTPSEAAAIKIKDKANNEHSIGKYQGEDTAVLSEFTYIGSDVTPVYPFKEIKLTASVETVAVPTVIPSQSAATVNITAKAYDTKNNEIALPSDAAWSLESAPAGVTLANGVLTVAPAASAGTATVKLSSAEKNYSVTKDITITKETPVAKEIVLTANGTSAENYAFIKPVSLGEPAKTVVFAATAKDQYGQAIAADISINASSLTGTSFADNTLTVNSNAENGDITVTATSGSLSDTITVKIASLDVNWFDVSVGNITYGQKVSDAVSMSATGIATANGIIYNGTFSVINANESPVVGTANAQVAFTITDDGEFKNTTITKDFAFEVNKADYNMNAVTITGLDKTYTGQAQEVTVAGTLPSGVSVSSITYNGSTEKPVNAGTYDVAVSFTGDAANYNAIPDKTATLTIAKADAVITANEIQSFVYDGTAKSATASLNHAETSLSYSATDFTAVGEYDVTITANETTNYNAASKQVKVVINKAAATGFATAAPTAIITAKAAFEAGVTSTALAKAALSLPATATATYAGGTEEVSISWADATETWNDKGNAIYTFVGTASSDNLSFAEGVNLVATYTVLPVNASVTSPLSSVTVAESSLADASDYTDIRLPGDIAIDADGETINITPVWNKTLDELKALTAGDSVTLEITNLPVWATIPAATIMFSVTDKYPVDVEVTLPNSTYVYGTPVEAPTAVQTAIDDGIDPDEIFTFKYVGNTVAGAVYESDCAPVDAGSYKVVATLVSPTHSGTASYDFTITPLDVTYQVNDTTKKYKDANPDFTGFVTSTLAYADTEAVLGVNFVCADTTDFTVGQTATISATISNANYNLASVVPGTLTVIKKPLAELGVLPVISGTPAVGETLTAALEGVDPSEYDYQWYVDGSAVSTDASYTPVIADSNKDITVDIIAKSAGNYEGTVTSEAVTVAKYSIAGLLTANITDGVLGTPSVLDAGDSVSIDVTSIDNYAELEAAGITFEYQWFVNGTAIAGETTSSLTLVQGLTGALTVKVTATGNFTDTIEHSLGEINKLALTGTITLALADGVISYTSTLPGTLNTDYTLTWYRDTEAISSDATYTVTTADYGKTITLKATAAGDVYTGEVISDSLTVPAIAPANVQIAVTETTGALIAKFTADENGAAITAFNVTITDGTNTQTVVVTPVNGQFTYTFTNLMNGTAYTITATATNNAGTSASATATGTPRAASGGGNYVSYTIKFNTNGGNTISAQKVDKGGVATEPEAPVKEGYIFEGWYKDAEFKNAYVFGSVVKSSITLYAKWTEENTGDEPVDPEVPTKLPFNDVPENEWYYDYVEYAYNNKLMSGISETTFDASSTLTRAMFVTVLYRMAGEPATNRSIPFADIDMGAYYANAVVWAQQTGLVNGITETEFAPDNNITREQMATIAYRYAKLFGKNLEADATLSYSDKDTISDYATDAVIWAASKGIMNGNADGTFAPVKNTTRAEAAAVFMRMVENLK